MENVKDVAEVKKTFPQLLSSPPPNRFRHLLIGSKLTKIYQDFLIYDLENMLIPLDECSIANPKASLANIESFIVELVQCYDGSLVNRLEAFSTSLKQKLTGILDRISKMNTKNFVRAFLSSSFRMIQYVVKILMTQEKYSEFTDCLKETMADCLKETMADISSANDDHRVFPFLLETLVDSKQLH